MRNKFRQLVDKLVTSAQSEGWLMWGHPKQYDKRKPGEAILNLTPEEREMLANLTDKDLQVRPDAVTFMEPTRRGRLGKHLQEQQREYEKQQQEKK